jgi:uncharacterized protein YlzI (FlbEa/FlbD family)
MRSSKFIELIYLEGQSFLLNIDCIERIENHGDKGSKIFLNVIEKTVKSFQETYNYHGQILVQNDYNEIKKGIENAE